MRDWLIVIRKKAGMPQYKVAAEVGISPSYYSAIELGTRNLRVPTAKKIAAVLGFEWQRFYE